MLRLRLLILCLLVLTGIACNAQVKELPVYNEWQGKNSTFQPDKPFFLIRDIHDLGRFWQKSGSDEPTPGIDFAKYMLLVWCPGSSLFDFVPVRIERFVYREGNYFVLMNFERKDTGGFWRRPFMATMLPRIDQGDIFIMRRVMRGAADFDWKPVFTIWDMGGDRKRPLEVAKLENPPPPATGFVTEGSEADKVKTAEAVAAVSTSAASEASPGTETEVAAAPTSQTMSTSAEAGNQTGTAFEPVAASSAGSNVTRTGSEAAVTTAPAAQTSSPAKVSTPAAVDEDPLFGTEFDITF